MTAAPHEAMEPASAETAEGASPHRRTEFPALDGLRIVAVTAVIGTHTAYWTGRYTRGAARSVLAHLDIGVAIFFVISGFLIGREWLALDPRTGGLPRVRPYAIRRLRRIMPAYWLALFLAVALVPANHSLGVAEIARSGLLLQTYGAGHLITDLTQSWSLCTEAAFYAVMPLIAWLAVRIARTRDRLPVVAVALCVLTVVASIAWTGWVHHALIEALSTAGYWLPTSIGYFAAGIALAAVRLRLDGTTDISTVGGTNLKSAERWKAVDRLGESPGVCVLIGLCAFALALTPIAGSQLDPLPPPAAAMAHVTLYLLTALAVVAPAVLGDRRLYEAVLGHPVMRYLGRISYSMFLFHVLVLHGVTALLGQPIFTGSVSRTFALTWLATLPIAVGTYHLVERPALRLGRRYSEPDNRATQQISARRWAAVGSAMNLGGRRARR
ncbi:acyltransferase family protein [Streptomyces chartreusis]|uniref:acyltransferase family protein n=1 Tax=Streptomyces chartreusis TaxID=1969 RepID=UPI00367F5952